MNTKTCTKCSELMRSRTSIVAFLLISTLLPSLCCAAGMGSQSWGSDYSDGGGGSSSDNAVGAFFGALLIFGGFVVWAMNVALRNARFWPFAITIGGLAWFVLEGGWNKFPVFGWLLVGLLIAAYYLREFGEGKGHADQRTPPSAVPDSVVICRNCGAALSSNERGLCADCRRPAPSSLTADGSVSPGVASHVAKSNIANVERSTRANPSEVKASVSLNHYSLLATVRGLDGTAIITMQQYEGGPWWSRVFLAKDVATTYLKIGLPVPPSGDGASLLAEAVKHYSEIADCLVDAQISPLAEAVADTAQDSIDLVTACLY